MFSYQVDVGAVPPPDGDAVVLEELLHQLLFVQAFKTLHSLNLILISKQTSTKSRESSLKGKAQYD
jgi:hypothetical protein